MGYSRLPYLVKHGNRTPELIDTDCLLLPCMFVYHPYWRALSEEDQTTSTWRRKQLDDVREVEAFWPRMERLSADAR